MSAEENSLSENPVEENHDTNGDSFVDAVSAISLVVIAVVMAVYWVSNQ